MEDKTPNSLNKIYDSADIETNNISSASNTNMIENSAIEKKIMELNSEDKIEEIDNDYQEELKLQEVLHETVAPKIEVANLAPIAEVNNSNLNIPLSPAIPSNSITNLPDQIVILTIDDDKWIQRIYTQYLSQWGFKHVMANNPFDGLSEAIKQQPHLIFLDMVLPEVNGITVLQFLRNMDFTANIPVVVVSGNMNKDIIKATYPYGVKGYVTKPFNQDTLYLKIKEVIDKNLFKEMVKAGRILEMDIKKKPVIATPNLL